MSRTGQAKRKAGKKECNSQPISLHCVSSQITIGFSRSLATTALSIQVLTETKHQSGIFIKKMAPTTNS
jgi:hypothetical protein